MSVLDTPRIYYRGEISWDPVTTNNYPANYNEKACETVFTSGEDIAAFRQSAIDQVITDGNWNPHGSYRSNYFNTFVSGVDLGVGLVTDDPFVNAPVGFTGMLIDAEPYGASSSQLFFDDMSFGISGGCRIYGKRVTRFHDRYINFAQNPSNNMIAGIASVMWQTCFSKEQGLVIDAHNSSALMALAEQIEQEDVLGVMVRWDSYRTVYYDDPTLSNRAPSAKAAGKALQAKLNGGGFQPNPARSLVVGTLGLWHRGDPIHEAGDRALVTNAKPVNSSGAVMGTAFARVSNDRVTLDLSNCVPDVNRDADKVDLGDLVLTATDPVPAVAVTTLATIPYSQYNKSAFNATSGIVDIPISPEQALKLKNMDLQLAAANGTAILAEVPLRAISGDPNLYIDQGEQAIAEIQVYNRGELAGPGLNVTLAQIGVVTTAGNTKKTDAGGKVRFPFYGTSGSVIAYALLPGDSPRLPVTSAAFNPQIQTYMTVRILPADADLAQLPPTWQNVLDKVLGNWKAMAPCMDNWLDLANPEQVLAYGPIIKKLTAPANFESYRYMPITRDLTMGQRALLYKFLGEAPVTTVANESVLGLTVDSTASDYQELSKSMRGSGSAGNFKSRQ